MNRKKVIALVMLIVTIVVLFTGWWIFLREDASKPEQEILFLYTMSDSTGITTRIIDNEGVEYVMKDACPFKTNNKDVLFSSVSFDKSEYQICDYYFDEDIENLYKLFNCWDFDNNTYEMKTYGMIFDLDIDNRLYIIKEDEYGKFDCYLLCQFAKPTKCVEEYKYRKYINYLIQKDIFPAQGSTFE